MDCNVQITKIVETDNGKILRIGDRIKFAIDGNITIEGNITDIDKVKIDLDDCFVDGIKAGNQSIAYKSIEKDSLKFVL